MSGYVRHFRARLLVSSIRSTMPVDILGASDMEHFHRDYYLPNRPAVLRGLRESSRSSIFDWSAKYFAERMADKVVPIMATKSPFLSYERNFQQLPFGEFV